MLLVAGYTHRQKTAPKKTVLKTHRMAAGYGISLPEFAEGVVQFRNCGVSSDGYRKGASHRLKAIYY